VEEEEKPVKKKVKRTEKNTEKKETAQRRWGDAAKRFCNQKGHLERKRGVKAWRDVHILDFAKRLTEAEPIGGTALQGVLEGGTYPSLKMPGRDRGGTERRKGGGGGDLIWGGGCLSVLQGDRRGSISVRE